MIINYWTVSVLILTLRFRDTVCLKNVKLSIEPIIVQYLSDSTLRCSYDLDDDILYSVKWYRGLLEFYRYTPSEHPSTKIFPFEGITVDESCSNSTQVVLRNIGFNLSGNFSCEVTTDLPHMVTGVDEQSMIVIPFVTMPHMCCVTGCRGNYANGPKVRVFGFPNDESLRRKWLKVIPRDNLRPNKNTKVCEQHFVEGNIWQISKQDSRTELPESSPKISVGRDALDSGDTLRANCSSPPSKPPVTLQFKLNDRMVAQNDPYPFRKISERSWSDLSLELLLSDLHFNNGRLVLRCIALLPEVYHDEVELELNSARNPIPQRVRGLNGVKKASEQTKLPYILLCYFLFRSAIVGIL